MSYCEYRNRGAAAGASRFCRSNSLSAAGNSLSDMSNFPSARRSGMLADRRIDYRNQWDDGERAACSDRKHRRFSLSSGNLVVASGAAFDGLALSPKSAQTGRP
jgi:hypothetical protein